MWTPLAVLWLILAVAVLVCIMTLSTIDFLYQKKLQYFGQRAEAIGKALSDIAEKWMQKIQAAQEKERDI